MNKETFLCRLRAIVRQVMCMSESEFNKTFKEGNINFDYFCWGEPAKIQTSISMRKMKVENLTAATIPLSDGMDPPAEQLPPPTYIEVSGEEYKRLMGVE